MYDVCILLIIYCLAVICNHRARPNVLTGLCDSVRALGCTKPDVSPSLDGFYPALEAGEIKPGMVLIFRYQGPKGAPGMPEVSRHLVGTKA
jgi:hypothetical protein